MDKKLLRNQYRANRNTLSDEEQMHKSVEMASHLSKLDIFKSSHHVSAYWAYESEIDPQFLLEAAWEHNKKWYLPVMKMSADNINTMQFVEYKRDSNLISHSTGILEPELDPNLFIDAHTLELVLVPLLACTLTGKRLGSGKGFYDQTFAFIKQNHTNTHNNKNPMLIGLAYDMQITDDVPVEAWDIPLDGIATESGVKLVL